jgi:ACS family tartrate transporter-like MFS transporter
MLQDLDLGEDVYGLGAGLFYVGYLVFELPSNLILTRIGARVWIARILLSWGVVSCSMMFVSGKWSFYALRILLGVAEAGFFPGIILYLSQWFPARARARAVAKFMAASAITMILGNPLSGAILQYMNHVAGLAGWQWVFLLEGLPAIILGFITIRYLTDRPEQAEWLKPAERDWLVQQLHSERQQLGHDREHTLRAALVNPRVWLLTGVYFAAAMGDNTFGFYLPTFLADMLPEWSKAQIGMLAAAPCVVALVAMILVGVHSDRTGERRWHVAGPAFAAAAGWVLAIWAQSPWFYLLALALTTAGMKSMLGTFWTLPMSMLKGHRGRRRNRSDQLRGESRRTGRSVRHGIFCRDS